ncbi:MAG: hypothetical protein GXP04_00575 [Alphaproteobacteria bacterium]|nr:hypothetical protein [Alphaproteobacteria bacterium]
MGGIGVPNILSFSRLSRIVSDIKVRADVTRTEATTGRREDITAAMKGDVGGAHLLKKAIDDTKSFQSLLALGQNRSQRTQSALALLGIDAVRIGAETLGASGRNDTQALVSLAADARGAISSIFSALNTTDGGRALFGGDVTDRPPLVAPEQLLADIELIMAGATDATDVQTQLDFYFNDPSGGFATSIYQGGLNKSPAVAISPGIRVDVSATAADQPIKDIIRGLAAIATNSFAPFADKSGVVDYGATTALGADTSITDLRAVIGVGQARIGAAISRHEAEGTILTSLFNEMTGRDQFEAASELQLLESQLEASYLLTARLARLTIADFIR